MVSDILAGTPVRDPLKPGDIVGIGRLLFVAKDGRMPDPKSKHDDDIKKLVAACKHMHPVSVAAYLTEKMHRMPLYVAVLLEGGEGMDFVKASDRGNGCITKVSPTEMVDAAKQAARPLMIKYDVGLKKFQALIPKA